MRTKEEILTEAQELSIEDIEELISDLQAILECREVEGKE